jgi:twinkle protein
MTSKLIRREQCPRCKEEGHDNSHDNLAVYDDGHSYCFRCGYMVGKDTLEEFTYEYLPYRGVTKETYRTYGVQSKIDSSGVPVSMGFNYPSGAVKVRRIAKKEFYWTGQAVAGLFGFNLFDPGSHKTITITEGELDAVSLYQVTRTPCVSVRSAGSAVSDVSSVRSGLNAYERILLAFDNDAAGREATAAVAKLFDHSKVYVVKFNRRKDANEYLAAGEGDDLLNLWHNAKLYVPSDVVCSFSDFREILSVEPKQGVPYPFPTLTKMTYGMRTGECVLLKAPEKVGKTAIMHHLLYQLLRETSDNVGAIFIEEPKQRLLQSIAGLELKKPVHLPDSGVSVLDTQAAVERAVAKDDRLFIYSHFGSNDPGHLLDTVRYLVVARACRWILFDHISMACTGIAGEKDERRALEYLATQLEMMVKELDFGLIMVSHVNDFGQTRGSHYLTKVADITISAERNASSDDDLERRTISLSVPYNRFCSNTGYAGRLLFDDSTYTLTEQEGLDGLRGPQSQGRPDSHPAAERFF